MRKMSIILSFLIVIYGVGMNMGIIEKWNDSYGTVYKNINYGEKEKNFFDLYVPKSMKNDSPQAVMLFIHGGSWQAGSRADMEPMCKRYAKAGYITATMSYSLLDGSSGINVELMLDEIGMCLQRVKSFAEELDIVVDKAALSGISAGGHLALLYAYKRIDNSPISIKFVFEQVGPVDFHSSSWGNEYEATAGLVSSLSGKTISFDMIKDGYAEDIINSISPLFYVNENVVPSILAYGAKDTLVLPIHPELFKNKLSQVGATYTYIEYPNSNHGLYSDLESTKLYHETILSYARKYFGY